MCFLSATRAAPPKIVIKLPFTEQLLAIFELSQSARNLKHKALLRVAAMNMTSYQSMLAEPMPSIWRPAILPIHQRDGRRLVRLIRCPHRSC